MFCIHFLLMGTVKSDISEGIRKNDGSMGIERNCVLGIVSKPAQPLRISFYETLQTTEES